MTATVTGVVAALVMFVTVADGLSSYTATTSVPGPVEVQVHLYGLVLYQAGGNDSARLRDQATWIVRGVLLGGTLLGIANGFLMAWVVGRLWRSVSGNHPADTE